MNYEIITKKGIEEMCRWLEFYDLNGYFPWEKKAVMVTISREAIQVLNTQNNKSQFVDNLILKKL